MAGVILGDRGTRRLRRSTIYVTILDAMSRVRYELRARVERRHIGYGLSIRCGGFRNSGGRLERGFFRGLPRVLYRAGCFDMW